MEDPPASLSRGHKQPPQYMLDLYNTVADVDGVTKDPTLLEGNTVRSFFDKCKLSFIPRMMFRLRNETGVNDQLAVSSTQEHSARDA